MLPTNLTLYSIDAVLILDSEGKRIYAKYYVPPHEDREAHSEFAPLANPTSLNTLTEQRDFERNLFKKTHKQNADVLLLADRVIVYKEVSDVAFYVIGSGLDENEAMLYNVVIGIRDSIEILLKRSMDRRTCLENFDLLALAVDETVDSGVILETDPVIIASRVSKAPESDASVMNIELTEQGLNSIFSFAKGKLSEKLKQFA
ncbi:zeta subunit of the coatomer complex [Nadsonia fulvescens var. elongata DSM 6958]|uniref:Coatomer subunit zeta n=1 Tax=Nadsonia fulvescens var. elongata DSM 6958 TaxID=857566 RepID=A0A1E3PPU7_9ASCO|nr:zeta subunit of the coatomer complex [Nadsonia fulvescens var. elongata DSM 6958]